MNKEIQYIIFGLCVMGFVFFLWDWEMDTWLKVLISVGAYTVGVISIAYKDKITSEDELVSKIMERMNKDGYECAKKEGNLEYEMRGRTYRTHFWKMGNGCFRSAIIDYAVIDEDWDKISVEGRAVLANYVNRECPHTVFYSGEQGVVCQYITCVHTQDDFMNEAKLAYDILGEALQVAVNALPSIKQNYLVGNHNKTIGFAKTADKKDSSKD